MSWLAVMLQPPVQLGQSACSRFSSDGQLQSPSNCHQLYQDSVPELSKIWNSPAASARSIFEALKSLWQPMHLQQTIVAAKQTSSVIMHMMSAVWTNWSPLACRHLPASSHKLPSYPVVCRLVAPDSTSLRGCLQIPAEASA